MTSLPAPGHTDPDSPDQQPITIAPNTPSAGGRTYRVTLTHPTFGDWPVTVTLPDGNHDLVAAARLQAASELGLTRWAFVNYYRLD